MEDPGARSDNTSSLFHTKTISAPADQLWSRAIGQLNEQDRQYVNFAQSEKIGAVQGILSIVESQKQRSVRKQWHINRDNKEPFIFREKLGKIASYIIKFKEIGDVLTQYDPAHAAIPWAAVRFTLQVGLYISHAKSRHFDPSFISPFILCLFEYSILSYHLI